MKQVDFLYGSKVMVQCQSQINMLEWKSDNIEKEYLAILKKPDDFFKYWAKLKHDVRCIVRESPVEFLPDDILEKIGTNIDDMITERNRVFLWTIIKEVVNHVPPRSRGHGKQQIILNCNTYCVKDIGITWNPK